MSLAEEITAGVQAQRLLDDPALQKAFDDVETAITRKWATSPVRDKDGQYELRVMLKLLESVKESLESAARNGKLAAHELQVQRDRESTVSKLRRSASAWLGNR